MTTEEKKIAKKTIKKEESCSTMPDVKIYLYYASGILHREKD
jgi:hypothetical protein